MTIFWDLKNFFLMTKKFKVLKVLTIFLTLETEGSLPSIKV